ncbi:MAG: hypothetical protein ACJ788_01135 [Ktedonobacteraceae bacterium]
MTLSTYRVELQDDHKHLQAVKNPRLQETPFRSPQLTLFDLGPHDWLLHWKIPDHAPARRPRRIPGIVQMPLFDPLPEEKAVGDERGRGTTHRRTYLRLVGEPSQGQGTEE